MMDKVKIYFVSFWKGFDPYNNFFLDVMSEKFNLKVTPDNPDVIIHSIFDKEYLKYNCVRIGYTGENTRPDFMRSDYYIGFDHLNNERYLRWPLFLFATPLHQLMKKDKDVILQQERKFAAFVVSNPEAKERIEFFKKMSKYKKVSSGGKVLNNIGHRVGNLHQFLTEHKFTIAFENSSYPGYTTEKLTQAMRAGSIPIYWGDPKVAEDFNSKSFINLNEFKSFDDAIEFVKEIDTDKQLYEKILSEPWLKDNAVPERFEYNVLWVFFEKIFTNLQLKYRKTNMLSDKVYYFLQANKIYRKLIK